MSPLCMQDRVHGLWATTPEGMGTGIDAHKPASIPGRSASHPDGAIGIGEAFPNDERMVRVPSGAQIRVLRMEAPSRTLDTRAKAPCSNQAELQATASENTGKCPLTCAFECVASPAPFTVSGYFTAFRGTNGEPVVGWPGKVHEALEATSGESHGRPDARRAQPSGPQHPYPHPPPLTVWSGG